ncbi:MraY family glycosyltransferase (plasmid) [Salipiger sp. H15]|uniref:MraY family glycosyltransferase n=1 Tax=Alloyangia sp. H15 TaxID=3029062 RepID=A0AAU8ARY6_9RHOB
MNVFLVSVVLIHFFQPLAVRLGFVDVPAGRKRHEQTTPTCGGIAILLAIAVAALFGALAASLVVCLWVLGAACIGAADDLRGLPATGRLIGYGMAALLLFVTHEIPVVAFGDMARLPGDIMPTAGLVIGFGFALLLLNSINMMDGLDGLAGGVSMSALFWLVLIASRFGAEGIAGDAQIVMAATAGFLVFNLRTAWRSRACVFLGDAGSTALGAALAYLILGLSGTEGGPTLPALLWLVAVPVIDTLSLIVRRFAAGRSPFSADRWHLHHLLLDLGLSHARVTLVISAIAFVCGGVGFFGMVVGVRASVMMIGLVPLVVAHTALVLVATKGIRIEVPANSPLPPDVAPFKGSVEGTAKQPEAIRVVH